MNALASDQTLRLARTIWHNPHLKGRITAGLFVGRSEREPHTSMGEDYIITNKDTLRLMPPDILLTNDKMLDRQYVEEHGSISNQECRELLLLGNSRSALSTVSKYWPALTFWSCMDRVNRKHAVDSKSRSRNKPFNQFHSMKKWLQSILIDLID